MSKHIIKFKDKDMKLYLDIVKSFKSYQNFYKINLLRNGYDNSYINKEMYQIKNKIKALQKRLRERLNIQSIEQYIY